MTTLYVADTGHFHCDHDLGSKGRCYYYCHIINVIAASPYERERERERESVCVTILSTLCLSIYGNFIVSEEVGAITIPISQMGLKEIHA